MIKRLEINLGKGSLETGFNDVHIQLLESQSGALSLVTSLAPAQEVIHCYQEWKNLHQKFYQSFNKRASSQQIEVDKEDYSIKSSNIISQYKKLKILINDWLHSRDFCSKEKQLRTALGEEDEIMVLISTKDELAWRLPWHLWSFFDDYRNAGIVLSHPEFRRINPNNNNSYRQKVLAIVDDRQNRNDLNSWAERRNIDLNTLSGDELSDGKVLQTISDKLFEQSWNIFFFAGHSYSDINNGTSGFCLKPNQLLTIDQLDNALKVAIERGLKLAIFNSCNGLGLARDLLKINLPKVVVMREDVPNKVAEEFLKYFLEEFMANKGTPAFLAVRRAREKLQGLENDFPSASLLPVICSNPATEPLVIHRKPNPLCMLLKFLFPSLVSG